jgi:putative membrane protein
MAGRRKDIAPERVAECRRLYENTLTPVRAIAVMMGISRNTVDNCLAPTAPRCGTASPARRSRPSSKNARPRVRGSRGRRRIFTGVIRNNSALLSFSLLKLCFAGWFNKWNLGETMTMKPMFAIGLAAAMALAASAAQAQSADKDSQKFIKSAIEGNFAEIDVGKLAQDKGTSPAVKSYGDMLVTDHSAANDKAIQAANQLGVTPPSGSGMSEKAEYLKLKVLSGASFDRTFAKDMVKDHQEDIQKFQKEANKADAAGTYAKDTLPTLQKHLQQAQQLTQLTTTGSGQ